LTRIFLIRHAEAEGNMYRRAHGHHNGLITTKGYVQIGKLEERLKDEHIDAVYSSDLGRTQVTSTAVTRTRGLPITTDSALREVHMGVWEDMPWGEIEVSYPEMSKQFGQDPAKWKVNGSESYEDVVSRMTSFITKTAKCHDGETIAIFSHGFAIRAFFCNLMGFASHESHNVNYCDNTAVALLIYDNDKLSIQYQSDNSHLHTDESTLGNQAWWNGRKVWTTENMHYMPTDEVRDAKLLKSYQNEFGTRPLADTVFTAYLSSEPAGLVGFDSENEDYGELKYIHLHPDFRNNNFGVQLIGQAISALRKRKRKVLRFNVQKDSPVMRLCLKHDFIPISENGNICLLEKNICNWSTM